MTFILQIILGIFILGILVLIHESGHFFVAKACGIRVIAFSIGFGKSLITRNINGTEYRISAIPFGGYVHMAGEHPEDATVGADDEFTSKPIWQRAAVAIAGPVANIVTSIIFLWMLFIIGVQSQIYQKNTVIGSVDRDSPAFTAGLLAGDSVTAINNVAVHTWDQIKHHFSLQEKSYQITYNRNSKQKIIVMRMPDYKNDEMPAYPLGGIEPIYPPLIGAITPGSAAAKQAVKEQDLILAIDNKTITTWTQIPDLVAAYNPVFGPLQLVIKRQDSTVILSVKPEYSREYKRFLLGIAPATEIVHYGPVEAIPRALEKSWEYTTLIFTMLSKLAHHTVSPKQLAGPVGIIQMSGAAALGNIVFLLNFMALIGINLGVLNLFPLIITDGGVIFFLLIESVRRKPLPLKAQLMLNRIAIAFFITLFIFVTFNDIMRIPTIFKIMGN